MNKKVLSGGLLVLVVLVLVIGYIMISGPSNLGSDKLKVAATVFPLADVIENIAGDQVEVVNIVPPGASPHTFEATPSDIRDLRGSEVIFTIGEGLDDWSANLLSSVDGAEVYEVGDGITKLEFMFEHDHTHGDEHEHEEEAEHEEDEHGHEHEGEEEHADEREEDEHEHDEEGMDPHYWLSTNNVKIVAENVAEKLIEIDPENAELYQGNLVAYQAELDAAHEDIEEILSDLASRELIVFHESWNYFAKEFDLEVVGVFTSSPGKEATPSELAELHDTAEEHGITAVFSEPQLSPETIRPFVEDLGLELYVLDPLGGIDERNNLINTLKYNAQTIQKAFGK